MKNIKPETPQTLKPQNHKTIKKNTKTLKPYNLNPKT